MPDLDASTATETDSAARAAAPVGASATDPTGLERAESLIAVIPDYPSPGILFRDITTLLGNARAFLAMEKNGEPFADFVWSFVDNHPQVTAAATLAEIPTTTPASDALSKALKKRGFKFVGSTICYSFMQACGLVNDHVIDCFCRSGGQDDS